MSRTTVLLVALALATGAACNGGSAASTARAAASAGCTITGTDGPDQLTGTADADVICGLGGADVISGGAGNDRISGGAGDDTIKGGDGNDMIRGGDGRDRASGGLGKDEIRGEPGNDLLRAGTGRDAIYGGAGSDTLITRDNTPYDRLDGGLGTNLCIADASDVRTRCDHPLVATHRAVVPVLMYHVIMAPTASTPLAHLYVAPAVFAAQMAWLDRHGYHVVTLQQVWDYWHGAPLPRRPIVVSFDDGFTNHYTRAMPILAGHGWAGTLNLAISHLNQNGWGLTAKMVQRMINHGWEVDSHTMTHPTLPGLSTSALDYQIGDSRSLLRRTFQIPVNFFCYPGGLYSSSVIAAVERAGYLGATSTENGLARWNDRWALDRVRVSNGDGVSGLAAHLRALGLPT
jgi:peptidoglycan/xylan/chitin deacetylase (PgdA/CDA1 family)